MITVHKRECTQQLQYIDVSLYNDYSIYIIRVTDLTGRSFIEEN